MNRKISEMMTRPYARLIWALICGCAYLVLIGRFVMNYTNTAAGGGIILWFFFPAVICGAALILITAVRRAQENGNDKTVLTLFYVHLLVIAMSIVFLLAGILA